MRILALIPCNNEAESLITLLPAISKNDDIDFVVVDDSSVDATSAIAKSNGFEVVRWDERRGRAAAVRDASQLKPLDAYGGLLILDGDGQHPAESIPQFVEALQSGLPIVLGNRFGLTSEQRHTPPDRSFLAAVLAGSIDRIFGIRFSDPGCGMLGVSKDIWCHLLPYLSWGNHLSMELVVVAVRSGMVSADSLHEIDIPAIYDGTTGRQLMKYERSDWHARLVPRLTSHMELLFRLSVGCIDLEHGRHDVCTVCGSSDSGSAFPSHRGSALFCPRSSGSV